MKPAHSLARNSSATRRHVPHSTNHANGNGHSGHARNGNGSNAAGLIERSIAGGVTVSTPRFVHCGKFVFNLDHVVSMKFGDDDVAVQLSDGVQVTIQDERVASRLLALLQCGDDVLNVTPPPGTLGMMTVTRYGQRLDIRVEHESVSAPPPAKPTPSTKPKSKGAARRKVWERGFNLRKSVNGNNGHGTKSRGRRRSA